MQPHELQHARLSCPSLSPRVPSNSRPLDQMPSNHLSVTFCSSCPQSFPASASFPMSWFFASDGQSIGASASASVLPMNIQDWSPLGWTGFISLLSMGLSRVCSSTTVQKHQLLALSFLYSPLTHLVLTNLSDLPFVSSFYSGGNLGTEMVSNLPTYR